MERQPFTLAWAREAGFGAKSLMRVQRAGLMEYERGRLRFVAGEPECVATVAIGPLVALSMRSAAKWYGWPQLEPPEHIELAVPKRRSPTPWPGARIMRHQLHQDDVVSVRGVPVTRPLRTAVDLALHLPVTQAVATLDGACRAGLRLSVLRHELHRSGRPKARRVAALINPARASVYETLFFLLVSSSGLPTPVCQLEIRHRGIFIARADFAWPKARLVVEIDGFAYHSDRAAFQADRTRQNALVNAGWRVLRFTAADLLQRPHLVIAAVREAL